MSTVPSASGSATKLVGVPRGWTPILEGESLARTLEAVDEIAAAVQARRELIQDGALASGQAGLAILFSYLDRAAPGRGHEQPAAECLSSAIDYLAEAGLWHSLYGGFAGIAWTAAHLQHAHPDGADEQFEAIDSALMELLSQSPWRGHYDLVGGLVGLGVYAVERLPSARAKECLQLVVERLGEMSQRMEHGVTWLTTLAFLPEPRRLQRPQGEYNLGVAHGVPGAIALLAQAVAAGVAVETARPLVEGAVQWLLRQRLPDCPGARFSYDAGPHEGQAPARSAWCYGDPGVAAALACAARCLDRPDWQRQALDIALESAVRQEQDCGVNDAGLCHGTAGLGHIYNRLFQATGEPLLADAARFWFERTFNYKRPEGGVAGFSAWQRNADSEFHWKAEAGFLEGAAGIALALLAAATPIEPAWDRVLLLSSAVAP